MEEYPDIIEWKLYQSPQRHYCYSASTKIGDYVSSFMRERLGQVKEKNDHRFEYTLFVCKYRIDWPIKKVIQGVATTLEEAKQKVESGWNQ